MKQEKIQFPSTTMIGALAKYISTENDKFFNFFVISYWFFLQIWYYNINSYHLILLSSWYPLLILSNFKSQKQKELERKLKDYKKLYKLTGKDFKRRARELGINQTELQYRRSYIFRQNYMKVMREKYSEFENFDKFEKWARKHKNPIRFYKALPDGEFYPDDLQYQSDVVFTQENFNSFLESLGIQIEETIEEG